MSAAQSSLDAFAAPGLSTLSDAEREAYQAVERDGMGVREFARETDRAPGTVGNLLRRARGKLDEAEG